MSKNDSSPDKSGSPLLTPMADESNVAVSSRLDLLNLAFDLAEFDVEADEIWEQVLMAELGPEEAERVLAEAAAEEGDRLGESTEDVAFGTQALTRPSHVQRSVQRVVDGMLTTLTDTVLSCRWSGTGLMAAAYTEARNQGMSDQDRSTLIAGLMEGVGEVVNRIASSAGANADSMHPPIELLETAAVAIRNDPSAIKQFADSFADIICRSDSEIAHALPVWCIGELTERGAPMITLARTMSETLLRHDLPEATRAVLRKLCERPVLAEYESLRAFAKSAPDDGQRQVDELVNWVQSRLSTTPAVQFIDVEEMLHCAGDLLRNAAAGASAGTIISLAGARDVLKLVGKSLQRKAPDVKRMFVQASFEYLLSLQECASPLPYFLVIEGYEPVRDYNPVFAATTASGALNRNDQGLILGLTICMCEGIEAELAAAIDESQVISVIPGFDVAASGHGDVYTFRKGSVPSEYLAFMQPLGERVSRKEVDGSMPLAWIADWATDRLGFHRTQ